MRKPNYRFERAERDRLKQAKKQEKLRRQQERTSQEKSEEPDQLVPPMTGEGSDLSASYKGN